MAKAKAVTYAINAKDNSAQGVNSAKKNLDGLKRKSAEFGKTGKKAMGGYTEGARDAAFASRELMGSIAGPEFAFFADMAQKSAEQLSAVKEAADKGSASLGLMKAAIIASIAYGVTRLALYVGGWDKANESIEKHIELAKKLNKEANFFFQRRQDRFQQSLSLVESPDEQRRLIEKQIKNLQKQIGDLADQRIPLLNQLKAQENRESSGFFPADQGVRFINYMIAGTKGVKENLELIDENIKRNEDLVRGYRDQLRGMSIEQAKAAMETTKTSDALTKQADATRDLMQAEVDRFNAQITQAQANTRYINSLRIQYAALAQGQKAANALRAELSGVDPKVIKEMEFLVDGIERLKNKDQQQTNAINRAVANSASESAPTNPHSINRSC